MGVAATHGMSRSVGRVVARLRTNAQTNRVGQAATVQGNFG